MSIVVSDTEPELGQKLVVHGKVSPLPGRTARPTVTLQVRYGGRHGWSILRTKRVDPTGHYELKARAKTLRDRHYQVTASDASGNVIAISQTEKVNVYNWIDLTTLTPVASNGLAEVASVTRMGGTQFPNSISATSSAPGLLSIDYQLSLACASLRATAFSTPMAPDASLDGVNFSAKIDGRYTAHPPVTWGGPMKGPLWHGSRLSLTVANVNGVVPSFGTPQVLCDPDIHLT